MNDVQLQEALDELEQPYLLEKDSESGANIQNLADLLMSAQDENVSLAIELIMGGGFPKELIPHAFLATKFISAPGMAARTS